MAVLSCRSCPGGPVLAVLSRQSYFSVLVLTDLPWQSCPVCDPLPAPTCLSVLPVPFCMSCSALSRFASSVLPVPLCLPGFSCPVLAVWFRWSHSGSPLLAVLFWLSYSGCPALAIMAVLFWPSCSGCPFSGCSVLAVLSWPSCPGSPVCPDDTVLQHGDMDMQHGQSAWIYSM